MNKIVKIFAAIAILSMAGIVMFNCGGGTSSDSTTDSTSVDTTAVVVDTTSVSGGAGSTELPIK